MRGRQSSPILEVRPGKKQGWWKRSTFRWNERQLTLDKTVGSRVSLAGDQRPIWGGDRPRRRLQGRCRLGHRAGRTLPHGDCSMYSQANVRAGKVLRPLIRALPSVVVGTEKVLWEADGSVELVLDETARGWKGVRPGVRLESRSGEPVRSPKNTSGSKDDGCKSSFCITDGHMSFQKCWIGGKAPKIQRSSCAPRCYCKIRFRVLCSIHWTRIIFVANDSSKSHGCHLQTALLRRTSSWRSICLYPGKNGRCSKIILKKFPNLNVQTCGFGNHDTNGQNHGPVWKIQSFFLSEICTVILWQDCYAKGNLRKSCCSTVERRFPIGNAFSYTVKKGYSYLCMWMTLNWLERNKILIKLVWENQHLPWSCVLGMHSKTMWNKQRYCGQLQNHVWIPNFMLWKSAANQKFEQMQKLSTACIDDHHFKEEELKFVGELSKVCCQIVLKCLYLARIGRPDILWSENKFARSITQWTKNLWPTIMSFDL